MSNETHDIDDLDDEVEYPNDEHTIGPVVTWLRKNNLSKVIVECSGGGDSGQANDTRLFRENKEVEHIFGTNKVQDRLEGIASDLADWDWVNDSGGTATITVHADGRYELTGGYYSEEIVECDPVRGSITDVPAMLPQDELAQAKAELATLLAKLDSLSRELSALPRLIVEANQRIAELSA